MPGKTFLEELQAAARRRGITPTGSPQAEPFAALEYTAETALKQDALGAFWRTARLPGAPGPLIVSPRPRGYRTTTKRRAAFGRGGPALFFPGDRPRPGCVALAASQLDGPGHWAVYEFLQAFLARPPARALARVLHWVIVRGSEPKLAVILNVRTLDARVVRAAKQLAVVLPQEVPAVRAAFLYLDPRASEYYLEARRPDAAVSFKQLFGSDSLAVQIGSVRLRFPVTAFSQVNGPMLPLLVEHAGALLAPDRTAALLDLYCGYGLFSLTLGRAVRQTVGVDADGPAIRAARQNAADLGADPNVRFLAGKIDPAYLSRSVRPVAPPELVLLDPPRQGTAPGVAAALAARRPQRVLHICCGTDEIPREVAAWHAAGYHLQQAVPLDLFPGTAALETLLLFVPLKPPLHSHGAGSVAMRRNSQRPSGWRRHSAVKRPRTSTVSPSTVARCR